MSAIGSLVFCTRCGNLLDGSTGNGKTILTCECCGAQNKDTSSKTVVTKSRESAFPSKLRLKRSKVQTIEQGDRRNVGAITQETCPECGRKETRFTTVQLRSADEGSTVFFTCECGHKWSTNN